MSAAQAWSVRDAQTADAERQAFLFNTCFRKSKDAATFHWKYRDNPHGPAIGKLACAPDGTAVGGYSYVPRRFRRDGQRVLLMQASDAMTLPEWQGQGIFTGLDDIVAEQAGAADVPWAFAYSGRLSLKGFLRNGWQHIGDARVYRWCFRSRRALLRLGRAGPLAALTAPLADVALGWRTARRLPSGTETVLARMDRFDGEADELFESCVPAVGLIGERDAAWLNWRYVDTPGRRQEAFALRESGRLTGWLVAEFADGHGFLVDHLAADEAARRTLLLAFTAMARARAVEEATALLCSHHPAVPVLVELGWKAPSPRRLFRDMFPVIVRACRPDSPPADLQITRWLLADGDRDAEHMSA